MNQFEIEEELDKRLAKAESDLEQVFAKRLKSILAALAAMYAKYERDGVLSFTELNKYNRFQSEMKRYADALTDDYKRIIKDMQELQETQYVAKYLLTAYLLSQTVPATEQGFTIPSTEVIRAALLNPIKELTLPKIFEQHRNDTVRRINIEIAQGIMAGESYAKMAKRLEKELGFASNKARTVARTEAGRARSISNERVYEQASQYTDTTKVWASALDRRVRQSHRSLDGEEADKNGVFKYGANFATAPRLFVGPDTKSLNINCRCTVIVKVDGKLPEYRRGRDYMDDEYQQKLADRIDKYMGDKGMTYKQAVKQAQREIQPPSRVIPYVSYEEWAKDFGA